LRISEFRWRERSTKPRRGMESRSRDAAPVLGAAVDGDADGDRVQ